ncbi:MAG: hypothetical protein V7K53_02250 [Nostoc sp.]|uniref:hypothetical protein n=1 Tax=Nostoc sp. TaxID=1180 RepID=UPI002FFB37A5
MTITVSASNRKIRDTTKSSLTAVYLPTVKYAAINLQSLSGFWFFHLSRTTTSSCLHLSMALCQLRVKTSLPG